MRFMLIALCVALSVQASAQRPDPRVRRVETEVQHELRMLPYYGVFDNLEFRVDPGGTVTLLGQVVRANLKSDAERRVKEIEGVERVVNEIEVLPVSAEDDRIRLAVARAIYRNSALERYGFQVDPSIHIIVRRGRVTLEGVVDNQGDKTIAEMMARGVEGTFGVTNNLRVGESWPKLV